MLAQDAPDGNAGTSSAEPIKPNTSRFGHFNAFIDHGQANLRALGCAAAAQLWTTLWRFESKATATVTVGLARLSACYGTDKRNIVRMLAQLELHGYLRTVEPGRPGRGSCAVYALSVPDIGVTVTPIKGVSMTPIGKGVTETPLSREKVSPRQKKGVTSTPVQKKRQKEEVKRARPAPENVVSPTAGKTPSKAGGEHREAVAIFCDAWAAKYGVKYPFGGGKDGTAIRAILAHLGGDVTAFAAVVGRFLSDPDPWLSNNRHTLGVMRAQLAKWVTDSPVSVRRPPTDFAGMTESRIAAQIAEALRAPDCPAGRAALQLAPSAPSRPEQVPIPAALNT